MNDAHELLERLTYLERQNRWFRRGLTALALAVGGLFVVAANKPALPTDARFRHLEAAEIVVRNSSGTQLHIWSRNTAPEGVSIDLTTRDASGLHVVGRFAALGNTGQLIVSRAEEKQSISLMPSDLASLLQPGGGRGPGIIIRGEAPFISVADTKKHTAILGATNLAVPNGAELNTTAASLHLFDDKGKVSWRAP